ncbi:hypothetical protein A2380_03035 [candidate division WWE3 bacterium RIFOXYB1_FULL_43_24]|uniref:Uncharacterized protein n=1 Tax=candidate division WWE3 bacterium GW2011_GWF1_42_14 TaxID=1619138 RepID=A0A0G1BJE3_UNCKA|nr:MAG: hypothetical protein UU92_C0007G0010 [candidate division WWE3 bacterium GW2011_GWA1_42_12]KKS37573.1 MAG: hypothetical protein UV00_C0013G0004 [candidate division WWE3 bacterium GW2011_GWF1_42_14]OGC58731.1 MAG: hypothetical protein A2212_00610 [candidate division WWE3 bacterium RIFOXYA1_FULL_42_9]OGC69070.1 MAG: hypothetical protein A2380_03035 [candidate division WWE3 bacterium RIFOXYB1_FULL_43_24]OGC72246.1 MAG: hypothetical protein A2414_01670 [candidate division WWE3 bacterium RIFO
MNKKWFSRAILAFNLAVLIYSVLTTSQLVYNREYATQKTAYFVMQAMGWEIKVCNYREYSPDWKVIFGSDPERYLFAEDIFKATEKAWENDGKYLVDKTDDNHISICPINSGLSY